MNWPDFLHDNTRARDLICMGRVAVDLYAEQIGCSLSDAISFKKYLGGCAGNIAVGTARLGLKTTMFSCLGKDEMGDFLLNTLQEEGINTDLVYKTDKHLTGLVLLGIKPPKDFPLMFYRKDCADMQLTSEQLSETVLKETKSLLVTGTGLSTWAMRCTTLKVVHKANKFDTKVILDLDYRPVLWGITAVGDGECRYLKNQEVTQAYQKLLPFCDLIVGTEEEFCIAGGCDQLEEALLIIRRFSNAPLVIKLGEKGCQVSFANASERLTSKPFKVEILNVLGAGDAFMSGLLFGLLQGKGWEEACQYANAAGAMVVTRHGCAPAMPDLDELNYFIAHYEKNKNSWQALAKAPDLVIKNTKGFAYGENLILTQMHSGMNFYCLKLAKGQSYTFNKHFEFAALLMMGKVVFRFNQEEQLAQRFDYFRDNPSLLHCPSGETSAVSALTDTEILLIETQNNQWFEPKLFTESNLLELDQRGFGLLENTSHRLVRTIFDKRNRPESNLVVGEIITNQGRWSSYPPHYHAQPEVYHYRFSEPQGFAFGENGKEVLRIEHYDTYQILKGQEHAHCTAPGYALYTLWFIRHLPDNPYQVPTFRHEHDWTRQQSANLRSYYA